MVAAKNAMEIFSILDKIVEDNLGPESIFFLGTGFAQMVEKLAGHHGF